MCARQRLLTFISIALLTTACHSSRKLADRSGGKPEAGPKVEHELLGRKAPRSRRLGSREDKLMNEAESHAEHLKTFIDDWYGTPHVMGGNTKKGVDCSGFVIQIYRQVYGDEFLGRRAEDLFAEVEPIKREDLQEGDLVFFRIHGRRIDHVGLYLQNDDFVHVSSSRGVMISNLSQSYYRQRFFKGGRKRPLRTKNQ